MTKSNIFNSVIVVSLIAAAILPIYTIFYLQPSFVNFITLTTEKDAVNLANHFSSTIFPYRQDLGDKELTIDDVTKIRKLQEEFNLVKIKIFTSTGKIIYSSDLKDIGQINTHSYFKDKIAKGEVFTKLVRKDKVSMEGQKMPVDVMETYVPIMQDNVFTGAFEIYYDITTEKDHLHTLVRKGRDPAIAISILLILAVIGAIRNSNKSLQARVKAEKAVKKANDELEQRVAQRTKDLTELNETLEEEVKSRKEIQTRNELLIADLTSAVEKVKNLSGLLPICSSCQQIRDSDGNWSRVEEYIQTRTNAEFTHGICPQCAKRLYPDLYESLDISKKG